MNKTRLSHAIHQATIAHHGQFDKGGNPYILHPLKLQHWLRGECEDTQIVAILHDVVEDTTKYRKDAELLLESIRGFYGDAVADAIDCLTKRNGEGYTEYLNRVMTNTIAIKVKMADLRHNSDIRRLKGTTQKDFERIRKYQEAYEMLKAVLAERTSKIAK